MLYEYLLVLLSRVVSFFARFLGIWYITDDITPHRVADESIKKWGNSSRALGHLLQVKSPGTNVLCASCILWSKIDPDDPLSALQTLQMLLGRLPWQMQANALALVTDSDISRTASILAQLSPPIPVGLIPVARFIVGQWTAVPRHDNLALHFYYSLTAYGISQAEAHLLLARALVARGLYIQAEQLLQKLAELYPAPDILWLLAILYQMLSRPPQLQLNTLLRFTNNAPSDARLCQAWKMIGDLYGEQPGDGMEAVNAYRRAEELGLQFLSCLHSVRAIGIEFLPYGHIRITHSR